MENTKFAVAVSKRDFKSIRELLWNTRRFSHKLLPKDNETSRTIRNFVLYAKDIEVMNICFKFFTPAMMRLYLSDLDFVLQHYSKQISLCAQSFVVGLLSTGDNDTMLEKLKLIMSTIQSDEYDLRELLYFAISKYRMFEVIEYIFSLDDALKINIHSMCEPFEITNIDHYINFKEFESSRVQTLFDTAIKYSRLDVMELLVNKSGIYGLVKIQSYELWIRNCVNLNILIYMDQIGVSEKFNFRKYMPRLKWHSLQLENEFCYIYKTYVKTYSDFEDMKICFGLINTLDVFNVIFEDALRKFGSEKTFLLFNEHPDKILRLVELDKCNELRHVIFGMKSMIIGKQDETYKLIALVCYKYGYITSLKNIHAYYSRAQLFDSVKYLVEMYPGYAAKIQYHGNHRSSQDEELIRLITCGQFKNPKQLFKHFILEYPDKTDYYELIPPKYFLKRWKRFYVIIIRAQNI